ncbi:MAG: hypothetical protein Q7K42_00450 [Candidatus Diapherotrites archaeon]|nr:hypothetical protein [Candidatus Diapherotrites archaeon]
MGIESGDRLVPTRNFIRLDDGSKIYFNATDDKTRALIEKEANIRNRTFWHPE